VVTEDYADGEKLHLGSRISITTPTRDKQKVVVTEIYEPPGAKKLPGDVSIA
jgi:hypothetical protein